MNSFSMLIIDRDIVAAQDLRGCLQRLDYESMVIVMDVSSAWAELSKKKFDLVLYALDTIGLEESLKEASDLVKAVTEPVVLVSSVADTKTLSRVREIQAAGFLVKPFAEPALRAAVELASKRPEISLSELVSDGGELDVADSHQELLKQCADPVVIMDRSCEIQWANDPGLAVMGVKIDEATGSRFWKHFSGGVEALCKDTFEEAIDLGEPRQVVFTVPEQDRWFDASLYPGEDSLLLLMRDVTERRIQEEETSRTDKMEALGLLARGFAHDFNNLLTVILGNLSMAEETSSPHSGGREHLSVAREATLSAQERVQQLLTFASGGEPIRETVNLASLLDEVMRRWQRQDGVRYLLEKGIAISDLHLDPSQVKRVVTNLIHNAEQASRGGGEITIALRRTGSDDEAAGAPAGAVCIEVTDTGEGIPPSLLTRVFEPYFTTREGENVSGIGLTVCESIMRAHGGSICLRRGKSSGTIASCFFPVPVVDGKEGAGAASGSSSQGMTARRGVGTHLRDSKPTPSSGGKRAPMVSGSGRGSAATKAEAKRILVLDDETPIRRLIKMNLERFGYEVGEAAEGSEAVEIYREKFAEGVPFDVVIVDLSIPGGVGGAVAMEQMLEIDPDVVAIVSSGYSDDPVMARFQEYGFSAVLPKPYEPAKLASLIESVIQDHPRVH